VPYGELPCDHQAGTKEGPFRIVLAFTPGGTDRLGPHRDLAEQDRQRIVRLDPGLARGFDNFSASLAASIGHGSQSATPSSASSVSSRPIHLLIMNRRTGSMTSPPAPRSLAIAA